MNNNEKNIYCELYSLPNCKGTKIDVSDLVCNVMKNKQLETFYNDSNAYISSIIVDPTIEIKIYARNLQTNDLKILCISNGTYSKLTIFDLSKKCPEFNGYKPFKITRKNLKYSGLTNVYIVNTKTCFTKIDVIVISIVIIVSIIILFIICYLIWKFCIKLNVVEQLINDLNKYNI